MSVVNEDIFIKIGTRIGYTRVTVAQYILPLKNSTSCHLGYVFLRHASVTIEDICLKFGM